MSSFKEALAELVTQLDARIHDLPDHPWIPGGEFADGELVCALTKARYALRVEPDAPESAPYVVTVRRWVCQVRRTIGHCTPDDPHGNPKCGWRYEASLTPTEMKRQT